MTFTGVGPTGQKVTRSIRRFQKASKHPQMVKLLKSYEQAPVQERLALISRTFTAEKLRESGIPLPAGARTFAQVHGDAEGEVEICLKGSVDSIIFEVSWDFGCLTIDVGTSDDDDDDD